MAIISAPEIYFVDLLSRHDLFIFAHFRRHTVLVEMAVTARNPIFHFLPRDSADKESGFRWQVVLLIGSLFWLHHRAESS